MRNDNEHDAYSDVCECFSCSEHRDRIRAQACLDACRNIPNPAAIPKAVEALRGMLRATSGQPAMYGFMEPQRQAATEALRDMGVEP